MFYVGRLARQREREQTEFRDSHELFMVLTIHTNAPTTAPRCGRWRWMLLAMMMLFAQTVAKQQTSMARSEALTKLDRHQVGWAGPGGMSKAMAAAQEALVTAQRWSPSERECIERV